jgi:hypothetical protein
MKTEFSVPVIVPAATSGSLADHVVEAAQANPDRVTLSVPRGDAWVGITAQQFLDEVKAVAAKYFGDDQLTVATLLPQPIGERKPAAAPAGLRH